MTQAVSKDETIKSDQPRKQRTYGDALKSSAGPSNVNISKEVKNTSKQTEGSKRSVTNNQRTKLVNIRGTRILKGVNNDFIGSKPVISIYVGGCNNNTTVDKLKVYCESQDVDVCDIEELNTRSKWYKSFKVSVDKCNNDKILNAEFWPEGVFCRKFIYPRK